MRFAAVLLGAMITLMATPPLQAQPPDIRAALAPTGVLRAGLVEAPSAGVLFVQRGEDGKPHGVTVDLVANLADSLDLPVAITVFPNTGDAADAVHAGSIDLAFMPVDNVRRQLVAFGPGYYELESTYLVSGASGITDVAEVNRPGLRVLAIAGTTTLRAASRTLTATQPVAVPSVQIALDQMRTGQADALALSRDSLQPLAAELPGSRIVTGGFQQTLVAVAVPPGRPAALTAASDWLNQAKALGVVRRIFNAHGLASEQVAP